MSDIKISAITKVKINNDKTAIINYVQSGDLSTSEVVFTGREQVTNEFDAKFQENIHAFLGCMPSLKQDATNIKMNVIKFDYGKENGALENVLYSVKYAFNPANNAVVNISTPLLPLYKDGMKEGTFYVSESHEGLLKEVIELAKAYINGDTGTKQGKLNLVVNNEEG